MYLWFDCEGSQSKTQVFVSDYLLCIARLRIQASTSTHKRTFSGGDCEGTHSNQKGASKSTVVRAITTTEPGINLKQILCIDKGQHCVQNVRSLCIRPQRDVVVQQPQHSR